MVAVYGDSVYLSGQVKEMGVALSYGGILFVYCVGKKKTEVKI